MHLVHHGQVLLVHTFDCLHGALLLASTEREIDGLQGQCTRCAMRIAVHFVCNAILHAFKRFVSYRLATLRAMIVMTTNTILLRTTALVSLWKLLRDRAATSTLVLWCLCFTLLHNRLFCELLQVRLLHLLILILPFHEAVNLLLLFFREPFLQL